MNQSIDNQKASHQSYFGRFRTAKTHIVMSCLLLSFILGGCPREPLALDCVEKPQPTDALQDPFDNVQVEIGIDGSGSILGFVSRPGSLYSEAIQSLSLLLANRNIQTRYWRVGGSSNIPQEISATDFLEGRTPKFYEGKDPKYPKIASTLHQIYSIPIPDVGSSNSNASGSSEEQEATSRNRVVRILITDLEPNQAAIDQLSKAVSQELRANPDYTAMLLGVKSQYQGHVFSADKGTIAIENYSTDGKNLDVAGRPFYILMTGPDKTLTEIVKNLDQLAFKVGKSFRVASFETSNNSVITLDNKMFSIAPEQAQSCTENISSIGRKSPHPEEEDQWLIFYRQSCDKPQDNFKVSGLQSQPSFNLRGAAITKDLIKAEPPAITIDQVVMKDDRLNLNMTVDPSKVDSQQGSEIYLTLAKSDLDRAVWSNWNTTVDQADGAKTQNLLPFISGLRLSVKEIAKIDSDMENSTQEKLSIDTDNAVKFCMGISP